MGPLNSGNLSSFQCLDVVQTFLTVRSSYSRLFTPVLRIGPERLVFSSSGSGSGASLTFTNTTTNKHWSVAQVYDVSFMTT
ncbi:hypothetical protein Y032_0014g2326 [Ancylostoma ceylanicum]|uniref:Uncharacterized protein n=1 Tax=Ancylostoma ceylanicum TaxID=53326 RepID=A0A016V9L3_9BILA|nr:hypothetical protein Y032_0014g2326 [Ancylostoma ceylanicum]